ncbi:DUF3592 domain-containing protein [Streptomyces sp. NPDC001985]|uniref:hypothetical protein n=1 Tax=Streptomyces sp. NPDC001985 TaxID=3154406 RepID=UPI00331CFB05
MTRRSPHSSVTVSGRSGAVWLERGSLVLDQDGVRRRIPLEAVEEVRAREGRGRGVSVRLTAPEGVRGTVYEVAGRTAREVTAFLSTVNSALPQRDRSAPRTDGAELVETVARAAPRRGWRLSRHERLAGGGLVLAAVLVAGAYLAGLVVLIREGTLLSVVLYLVGVKPLIAGVVLVVSTAVTLTVRSVLRMRGVPVVATSDRDPGKRGVFHFTDIEGRRRSAEVDQAARRISTSPAQVRLLYDPRKPERTAAVLPARTWVLRTLGFVFLVVPLLALGLFMVPFQVVAVLFP